MSGRTAPTQPVTLSGAITESDKVSGSLAVTLQLPPEVIALANALTTFYTPLPRIKTVALTVNGITVFLQPQETTLMAVTLSIGHTLTMSLSFLDQSGNPMLTMPVPDAAPTWTDTTPATETLVAAASGLTCVGTPIA